MEPTEKCKVYVASQAEEFAKAIEKAYMQGYSDALEEKTKITVVDGVEYIDLGLKSGTLWALREPEAVSYKESQKLNIPTLEQISELIEAVRWKIYCCGNWVCDWRFCFIDREGEEYQNSPYDYTDGSNMKYGDLYMWYRSELNESGNANIIHLSGTHSSENITTFPGYIAYAFYVK